MVLAGRVWAADFDCRAIGCPVPVSPVPDTCATAYTVVQMPFVATPDTLSATRDTPRGDCDSSYATTMRSNVWFHYTAPTDGPLDLQVRYETYNGLTAIYTGPDCAHLTPEACPNAHSLEYPDSDELSLATTAGTTYWFRISKYGVNPGGGATRLILLDPPSGCAGDCDGNGNGHVGIDDIDPFVALIPSVCP